MILDFPLICPRLDPSCILLAVGMAATIMAGAQKARGLVWPLGWKTWMSTAYATKYSTMGAKIILATPTAAEIRSSFDLFWALEGLLANGPFSPTWQPVERVLSSFFWGSPLCLFCALAVGYWV